MPSARYRLLALLILSGFATSGCDAFGPRVQNESDRLIPGFFDAGRATGGTGGFGGTGGVAAAGGFGGFGGFGGVSGVFGDLDAGDTDSGTAN